VVVIVDLIPVRSSETLTLARAGADALVINGEALDFAPLPEGAVLPPGATGCDFVLGPVTRIDGALRLTLRLPHTEAAPGFAPAPLVLDADGPVALPVPLPPPHDPGPPMVIRAFDPSDPNLP
jgi:hypothetical protein